MAGSVIGALRVSLGLDASQFQRGAGQAGRSLAGLRSQLLAVSAAVAAMGAAALALVTQTAQAANEVARQAQIAGTSAEQFQRWAVAARSAGVDQEKLAGILKDVNDRVGEFLQTGGGPMQEFFDNIAPQVGVTADMFRDLSGADALQLYVSTLERAGLSQQEMTYYLEQMAGDATALLPLLRDNGAELGRWADIAQESGAIMSDSLIEKSAAFRDEMTEMQLRLQGLRNQIAEHLMPIFTKMIDNINNNIIPAISDVIGVVGEWVTAFQDLPGPVQDAAAAIGLVLGVGGPILLAIGVLKTAIMALIGSAGPIGLLIAIAGLIVTAWLTWRDEIIAAIEPAITWMMERFTWLVGKVQAVIDIAIDAKNALVEMFTLGESDFAPDPRGPRPAVPAYQDFAPVGGAIVEGLNSGIQEGDAESQLRNYLDGLVDTAEDQLEINSPSRVFQRIGQWISEGLGLGIRDGEAGVAAAVGDVVGSTADAVAEVSQALQSVAGVARSAFAGLVRGTTSWRDALGNVLDSLADIAINAAFNGLFGGLFQSGSVFGQFVGALAGPSFEGGGFTGYGDRVGGIDGRGGFAAVLHPNEVVMDLARNGGGFGGDAHVYLHVPQGVSEAAAADIAGRVAVRVVSDYDQAMPSRVAGITKDPRRR